MPRYQIRLYKPHDLDLIELVARHRFCLQKAAYCCLSAFLKGEYFLIRIPKLRDKPLPGKKVYARILRLSEKKSRTGKSSGFWTASRRGTGTTSSKT